MFALTESDIPAYLYFGYVPCTRATFADLFDGWDRIESNLRASKEYSAMPLVEEGARVWKRAVKTAIDGTLKGHVLPLSAGLDSRAILGGLLENLETREIQAVTFGSPGTWDFEIGQQVAKAAGVRCDTLDLTSDKWEWDANSLAETAANTDRPVWVFDAHVNRSIARHFGKNHVYWSGYMGGGLAGGKLVEETDASWHEAKQRFGVRKRFAKSLDLAPADFKPEDCLPAAAYTDPSLVCYAEQLDWGIEDCSSTKPTLLSRGYEYRTPFMDPEWVSFILGAPRRYRSHRDLYKQVLKAAYPKLFALPTKKNFGLPLGAPAAQVLARRAALKVKATGRRFFPMLPVGIEPSTNYIGFNRALRQREDVKRLVNENLQDLKKRGVVPWLDLDAIWLRHQRGDANHGDALTLLASLEIYLKASPR